jgi:hypothetical protein
MIQEKLTLDKYGRYTHPDVKDLYFIPKELGDLKDLVLV